MPIIDPDALPSAWDLEANDAYRPAPDAAPRRFATYVHDSGDVSLRIAPATLEATERPGYELTVTTYPGLDFESRTVVRTVTTYASCTEVAREFASLFDGALERSGDLEAAVEYASAHVQPSTAADVTPARRTSSAK